MDQRVYYNENREEIDSNLKKKALPLTASGKFEYY
jgi:hypothetical protein